MNDKITIEGEGGSTTMVITVDENQPPIDTGVIHRTGAIQNVCSWLREIARSGRWPDGRIFFSTAEPGSINKCAEEIEKAFLGKKAE